MSRSLVKSGGRGKGAGNSVLNAYLPGRCKNLFCIPSTERGKMTVCVRCVCDHLQEYADRQNMEGQSGTEPKQNRLARIRWDGTSGGQMVDMHGRVTLTLTLWAERTRWAIWSHMVVTEQEGHCGQQSLLVQCQCLPNLRTNIHESVKQPSGT